MFNCLNERGNPAIRRDSNGEWMIDYDVLSFIKKNRGFPIQRLGFLKVLAGLDDPCTAPNPAITEEYTEYFKEGYSNIDVDYFSFGHLTTMVNAPVVEESMMKYDHDRFVTRWSRNTTDDAKMKEAEEIYRARNSLLSVLM